MKIKLTANIHLILHIHSVSYDTYHNKYRGEKFEDDRLNWNRYVRKSHTNDCTVRTAVILLYTLFSL